MRNKKIFAIIVSLITAVVMMVCVSYTVLAVDTNGNVSHDVQLLSNSNEKTLPELDDEEIVQATEFEIPDVPEVSLISGVVSWLCVAVGIAVLAGVLVSQRTKQVQKPDNRRR